MANETDQPKVVFERVVDAAMGLRLRTLLPDDARELFSAVDANRAYLRQWLPWLDANTEVAHSLTFIRSTMAKGEEALTCAILLRGSIVGIISYHHMDPANRSVELGYWLGEPVAGRGIMTRCCRVMIDHAFTKLGLNRVIIRAAVDNERSRTVAERLGLVQEGILREAEWLYDHYVDLVVYAVLKRDWTG